MIKTVLLNHEKFRKEIETLNLSQEEIAAGLGISGRHVRNLKTKDSPVSACLLYQMSVMFHKSMEYFLIILEKN